MHNQETVKIGQKSLDKVKRYGWTVKDSPGKMQYIDKHSLLVNQEYQRKPSLHKIADLASMWSWVSAGVIIVGEREGKLHVIDGQHRLLAALRRSDISTLPCLVFKTEDVRQEAVGFLDSNINRKAMSSIATFNAMVVAGDSIAKEIKEILDKVGISLSYDGTTKKSMRSIKKAMVMFKKDRDSTIHVLEMLAHICEHFPVYEILLGGLWYIYTHKAKNTDIYALDARIIKIGCEALLLAGRKSAMYFALGGDKIWGKGMLDAINKGLRNKFVLEE